MTAWCAIEKKYKQADLALHQNRFEEAIALLRELSSEEPEEPLFHWRLGYALGEMHDYRGAVRELRRAIRLDPDNVAAWGCCFASAESGRNGRSG